MLTFFFFFFFTVFYKFNKFNKFFNINFIEHFEIPDKERMYMHVCRICTALATKMKTMTLQNNEHNLVFSEEDHWSLAIALLFINSLTF